MPRRGLAGAALAAALAAQRRPDQSKGTEPAPGGLGAGFPSSKAFRGRLVVVSGTGANTGVFVYSPTPAAGNLIASIKSANGTDPYGNFVFAGITEYNFNATLGKYIAINIFNNAIAWWEAASQAGPYSSNDANSNRLPGVLIDVVNGVPATSFQSALFEVTSALVRPLQMVDPSWLGGTVVTETWHAMSLTNGWSQSGTGATCSYRMTIDNEVELVGACTHASVSGVSQIARALPLSYWPVTSANETLTIFNATNVFASSTVTPRFTLTSAGIVQASGLPAGTTSIEFRARFALDR